MNKADKGLSWGVDNIKKEDWIDIKKKYKTRGGKEVELSGIVMVNGIGNEVTYPVKGLIILKQRPRKTENCIWSLDGKYNVINNGEKDLVKV